MALLLANIELSDTFNTWRVRTNQINAAAAGIAANNTFTGSLNTFNNTVSFKGNVTAPNITANSASFGTLQADFINLEGDITVDVVTANTISGTTLTGTLSTAAQPNITSIGSLSSLTVAGDISGDTISANTFSGDGSGLSGISAGVDWSATTINAAYYPLISSNTSGSDTNQFNVVSAFTINPSTGQVSATDFNSTSDIKMKTSIAAIENPIDTLLKLSGKVFNWKHTGKKSYGVIAQEIEQILPDVVTENINGKAVNYNTLIAFLIESNKELVTRVKHLEEIINK